VIDVQVIITNTRVAVKITITNTAQGIRTIAVQVILTNTRAAPNITIATVVQAISVQVKRKSRTAQEIMKDFMVHEI